MDKDPKDPLDHARTTRPHAGETMTDSRNIPALAAMALAAILFFVCLAAFATGHPILGIVCAALSVVGFLIMWALFAFAHRKTKDVEKDWYDAHPEAPRQPPAS